MTGDPIPDEDHVGRYCKPSSVDEQGMPMASAFQLRSGEQHLSVNWLEHGGIRDVDTAMRTVRSGFVNRGYRLRGNGRFAVLNVGSAKTTVRHALGHSLRVDHLPLDDDQSHAGIHDYTSDDLAVAVELKALLSTDVVHPAVL